LIPKLQNIWESTKLKKLWKLITKHEDSRIVIVSAYVTVLQLISQYFLLKKLNRELFLFCGTNLTPVLTRANNMDNFKTSTNGILLLSKLAGGMGLWKYLWTSLLTQCMMHKL